MTIIINKGTKKQKRKGSKKQKHTEKVCKKNLKRNYCESVAPYKDLNK